ncbi:uncharacterized protein LOC108671719 [Hyalella azteca]|uniref:Uncharacterized protein LOC108671719 n=1 Tax=Hyalella azteca TaxID=294128 RepID=A0A8B7NNQ8_HYAAZ|nr:uncharacterized protein LOC108671719 [Hyalella azteca]
MAAPVVITSWKSHQAHCILFASVHEDVEPSTREVELYISESSCNEYNDHAIVEEKKVHDECLLPGPYCESLPQDYTIRSFSLEIIKDYHLPGMPLDTFQSFSSYWATNGAVLCCTSWVTLYPFLCQRSVVDWSAKALRETYELMPCLQWLSCYHDVDASTASLNLVDEGACGREVYSECGVELIKVDDRSQLLRSAYQKFVIFRYV